MTAFFQCQGVGSRAIRQRVSLMIVALSFALGSQSMLSAREKAPGAPKKKELPQPAYMPVEDDPALPRVLILGDSISIGYTIPVRNRLKGKANIHRPPTNCNSTVAGLMELDKWLATDGPGKKWDVIHFNWGLHDLKYVDDKGGFDAKGVTDEKAGIVDVAKGRQNVPLSEYEKNLRELTTRLKTTGATLIWCSTTPVPAKTIGRVAGDEVRYNEAAARVMKDASVMTDDLCGFAMPQIKQIQREANVHYTDDGYGKLADQVASSIEKALAERKAAKP